MSMIVALAFLKVLLYLTAVALAVAAVHEVGHATAAVFCGHRIVGVRISWTGLSVRHEHPNPSLVNRMIITASGPGLGLLSALVCYLGGQSQIVPMFMAFEAVNLFWPTPATDGYRLLQAFREWRKGR